MFLIKRYLFLIASLILFQTANAANPPAPLNINSFQSYNSFEWENGKYIYDRAHIPPLRYTDDGRVGVYGISVVDTDPGNLNVPKFYFNLIRPESIEKPHHMNGFIDRANFIGSWHTVTRTDIENKLNESSLFNGNPQHNVDKIGNHITLCDPTQFSDDNAQGRKNPYRCDANSNEECYDVKLIGNVVGKVSPGHEGSGFGEQNFFSLPITIRIQDPKTSTARIQSIEYKSDEVTFSPTFKAKRIFEPIIAGDGRLMVYRVDNNQDDIHEFEDENGNVQASDELDIVYSVYNKTDSNYVCDVNGWDTYYPITFAHYDSVHNMKGRYKFASEPMRDSRGNRYEPYKDTGATYPWIDKNAANLAFAIINRNSDLKTGNGEIRYNGKCDNGGSCPEDQLHGVAVNGMWTRWKTVLLDGVINPADFGLHWRREDAVDFELYNNSDPVKVSGVRAVESSQDFRILENGFPTNTTIIDTIENSLNYIPEMKPQTPRDTVWKFGNSLATTEVAFDDYINNDVLINASMTGLLAYLGEEKKVGEPAVPKAPKAALRNRYYDGFNSIEEHTNNLFPNAPGGQEPILFQNSATNEAAPSFGVLEGAGRIEPIAAGGIHGKGVYLRGDSKLRFELERGVGATAGTRNMYIGFFLNQRGIIDNEWRPLFKFSDDTEAYILRAGDTIRLRFRNFNSGTTPGVEDREITLPAEQTSRDNNWLHIGLEALNRTDNGNSELKVYQNGNFAGSRTFEGRKVFLSKDGSVLLGNFKGHEGAPIEGWFDEFKVKEIAEAPRLLKLNKEEICNHARGTFIHTPSTSVPVLQRYAAKFDGQNHELNTSANTSGFQFVCLTNYVDFEGVKFSSIEEDKAFESHTSLNQAAALGTPARTLLTHRESLNQDPDSPRPDSSNNDFCLSCHNFPDTGNTKSLSIAALVSTGTIFKDGPRQPTQPPRTISGKIPPSLSNPSRWAVETLGNDGNVENNSEYTDVLSANASSPPDDNSKVVFIRYKSLMVPVKVGVN